MVASRNAAQVKEVVMNRYFSTSKTSIHIFARIISSGLCGATYSGDRLHFGFRQRRQFDFAFN